MSPIPLGIFAVSGAAPVSTSAYDLLNSVTVSAATTTITFSNLNVYSEYKHLEIVVSSRAAGTNTTTGNINITFNGDTGSNYSYYSLSTSGSSLNPSVSTTTSDIRLNNAIPGGGKPAGEYGIMILDVLDFASTTSNKSIKSLHGAINGSYLQSGTWYNSSSPITSMTFTTNYSLGFTTDTTISLYGVK